jgi:uncharacterized protein YneF (UPF0154 family)
MHFWEKWDWSKRQLVTVIFAVFVVGPLGGILLGKFISKKFILNTDVSDPVLKEYKSATENYIRLMEELNKAIELYDSGKGNLTPLLEADYNLEAAEKQLEATGNLLQLALRKNSEKHFETAKRLIRAAVNYMKTAEEKIQEFQKSAQ